MEKEMFFNTCSTALNEQQQEAVQSVEGPTLLLAVPGSGKTTVLVTRLGYMINCCGINPESILTVTYTVAATKELGQRFASKFGEDIGSKMSFWTINGLSARIINYYSRFYGKGPTFRLISDEKEITRLLSSIHISLNHEYPTEATIKTLRTAITYAKNKMFRQQDVENMDIDVDNFAEIYKQYNNYMLSHGFMDFDDQMVYAHKILRVSPQVLKYFQTKFQYICVDESQDTSQIQHAIIALLAQKSHNIFMVGDEDQSIYGFRAAYPEALVNFDKNYQGAKVLLMEENFRSTAEIVDVANAFVKKNRFRHEKTIKATQGHGAPIHILPVKKRENQFEELLKVAQSCTEQTAVLFRNNESVIPLVDLLERNNLDYTLRNIDAVFFTHRIVVDITDIIRFAYNPMDAEVFMRIYYKLDLYLKKGTAQAACNQSARTGRPILDCLYDVMSVSGALKSILQSVRKSFKYLVKAKDALDALDVIWTGLKYKSYVKKNHFDGSKYDLLRIIAKNEPDAKSFIQRLDELNRIIRTHDNSTNSPFILSTIHSSKGLEYKSVYLLDVVDNILPSISRNEIEDDDYEAIQTYEEERRLFYVGMTRAKKELTVFNVTSSTSEFIREVRIATGDLKESEQKETKKSSDSNSLSVGLTRERIGNVQVDKSLFREGARVEHRVYGLGTVRTNNGKYIKVWFGSCGTKTLDLKFCISRQVLKEVI